MHAPGRMRPGLALSAFQRCCALGGCRARGCSAKPCLSDCQSRACCIQGAASGHCNCRQETEMSSKAGQQRRQQVCTQHEQAKLRPASPAQRQPLRRWGCSQAQHVQQHGGRQRSQRLHGVPPRRRAPRECAPAASAGPAAVVRRQQQGAGCRLESRGHPAVALRGPGGRMPRADQVPQRPATAAGAGAVCWRERSASVQPMPQHQCLHLACSQRCQALPSSSVPSSAQQTHASRPSRGASNQLRD